MCCLFVSLVCVCVCVCVCACVRVQHGTPPLLIAAGCGNVQIIEVLIAKGAEIKANDKVLTHPLVSVPDAGRQATGRARIKQRSFCGLTNHEIQPLTDAHWVATQRLHGVDGSPPVEVTD